MPDPTLSVQRIYTKSALIETPNTPEIFRKQGNPIDEVRIDKNHIVLETNYYEVILDLAITTRIGEEILSLIKLQQAGIFKIENVTEEQLDQILQTECLNALYPYAMQKASDLSVWSTYRPIIAQAINFHGVYHHLKEQEKEKKKEK